MQESAAITGALRNFYERLTAGDVAAFDDVVSASPATSIVGTGLGEWVTERERFASASRPKASD